MQTSINLQGLYEYSTMPIIIILGIVILLTIYLVYIQKKKTKDILKIEEKPKIMLVEKNIPEIKNKYLKQIDIIEKQYKNNELELRKAYQKISEKIRLFVFEVTDIKTQNYSLYEIRQLNMPNLYELIKEYYKPEFSSKSEGDFIDSINKARRIINEWN